MKKNSSGNNNFKFYYLSFIYLFIMSLCSGASGGEIRIGTHTDCLEIGNRSFYIEDKQDKLTIEDILNPEKFQVWESNCRETLSFGYTSSTYWVKVSLKNAADQNLYRLLEIAYPVLDYIDVYIVHDGKLNNHWILGDKRPFSERPVNHRNFVIPVEFRSNLSVDFYIRVKTSSSMQFPLIIWKERTFLENDQKRLLGLGIYVGIMLVMAVYNIFIFFSLKEKSYFYYVLYVVSMAMFLTSMKGLNYQYLWPEATIWNDKSILVGLSGVCLFALLFVGSFLDIYHSIPSFIRPYKLLGIYCLLMTAGTFLIPYYIAIKIVITTAVFLIILAFIIGVSRWLSGDSTARFFTIAWISLFFGGVLLALNKFGVLPDNFVTNNAVQFGSAIEVLILSFALADRLNIEKKNRFKAQLNALENEKIARSAQAQALEQEKTSRLAQEKALKHEKAAREAQDRALQIQKQANETLEQRVFERTRDLEKANRKLKELSTTDGLTGLKNRRFFNEVFHYEFIRAVRDKTSLAVLLMDIDRFKRINDTFGHLAGDDCLKKVAERFNDMIRRECDFLARYGGEEFCVILPNTKAEGALRMAESIRSSIESLQFMVGEEIVSVNISIGVVAEIPDRKEDLERFLNKADEALYISKKNGRNRVTLYETDISMEIADEPDGLK